MATAKKTAKPSTSKEVAVAGKKEVAKGSHADQLPASMANMSQYSGAGLEGTDRDSFAIPFLAIIQKTSPQVDKDTDQYIKGAETGDLLLTSTNELFKDEDGVDVVFCGYRRAFLRWAPIDSGGGFKGEISVEEISVLRQTGKIQEQDGRLFADNGDIIADTRIHYVLVVRPDGTFAPAVMSFKSTQIKKSKMLMTQIQGYTAKDGNGKPFTPPSFGHVFHAETVAESNDKGSWRGWKLTRTGFVEDSEVFQAAVEFHKTVVAGEVKVNYDAEAAVAGNGSAHDNDDI